MEVTIANYRAQGTMKRLLKTTLVAVLVFLLICLLVLTLSVFTNSTMVLGFKTADFILTANLQILGNPVTALLIGILCTSILQQPKIILTMLITLVSQNHIHPLVAIPVIMGMNIGCYITPILVSLVLFYKRSQFKHSISTALLAIVVSCVTTALLLPLEFVTGFMYELSKWLTTHTVTIKTYQQYGLLQSLIKPVTDYILQTEVNSSSTVDINGTQKANFKLECSGLFTGLNVSCVGTGWILLITSLILGIMVIILVNTVINREQKSSDSFTLVPETNPKQYCSYLKGYVIIIMGCVLSIFVQDIILLVSVILTLPVSRFTHPEHLYPLILGSNIGTALSLLFAAMSDLKTSQIAFQMVYCHLIFIVSSFVLFYVIPYSSSLPLRFAEILSKRLSNHRWFFLVLTTFVFFGLPAVTYGLSLADHHYVIIFLSFLVLISLVVSTINLMQIYAPTCLPQFMKTWEFLPECMRSLEPYEVCANRCYQCITSSSRYNYSASPDQSAIKDHFQSEKSKDVYVIIPESQSCCCCPWFVPTKLYTKYSLTAPTQTSTPKCPPKPSKTPVLVNYNKPQEKEEYESELVDTICNYDPREALNFGTLGFEDDTYSSSEETSEDPSDFTRTVSTESSSSSYSFASISGDNIHLLHHAF